jgi:hypothetical protein
MPNIAPADAHQHRQQDQDVDRAQPQDREDRGGGARGIAVFFPRLQPDLGAKLAGEAAGVAQRRGHIVLAASGGDAVGEVGVIVCDNVGDRLGGKAGEALTQPGHERLTGHLTPPRMPLTAPEKDAHAAFCEAKLAFPASVSR